VKASFIDGENRSTRRKPPTCSKSLTHFVSFFTKCLSLSLKRQTYGEKRDKDKHVTKKETNQTLGEKEAKANTWPKKRQRQTRGLKERKTTTWPKKRERQTLGEKREKDKHLVKKERTTSTW
jgi:hypothetical protein